MDEIPTCSRPLSNHQWICRMSLKVSYIMALGGVHSSIDIGALCGEANPRRLERQSRRRG